ncbi:MAG: hypothetical protein RMX96_31220 [Nostoc sp. ChiSLP02]|nr:hypothetical protein [Nostoc sp. ChiSLP02]
MTRLIQIFVFLRIHQIWTAETLPKEGLGYYHPILTALIEMGMVWVVKNKKLWLMQV